MTELAATGPLSLPREHARTLLANLATWQTITNADDATEAKDNIYIDEVQLDKTRELEPQLTKLRPFALVFHPPEGALSASKISTGTFAGFRRSGIVHIAIEIAVAEQDIDTREASTEFSNKLGALISELLDKVHTTADGNDYLMVQDVDIVEGPFRSAEEEIQTLGDYYWAIIQLEWSSA